MNTKTNNGSTKKPGQNQNRAHHIVKTRQLDFSLSPRMFPYLSQNKHAAQRS